MAKLIAQYQDGEEMQLFALIKEAAAKTTSACEKSQVLEF